MYPIAPCVFSGEFAKFNSHNHFPEGLLLDKNGVQDFKIYFA
jgi:hypothetical protein